MVRAVLSAASEAGEEAQILATYPADAEPFDMLRGLVALAGEVFTEGWLYYPSPEEDVLYDWISDTANTSTIRFVK